MRRYWISWFQPGPDFRPMTYPPNRAILGWWHTGYGESSAAAKVWGVEPRQADHTLVALVEAEHREAARAAVLIDWPDAGEERFCEFRQLNFRPGDRFPLSPWMAERIEATQ